MSLKIFGVTVTARSWQVVTVGEYTSVPMKNIQAAEMIELTDNGEKMVTAFLTLKNGGRVYLVNPSAQMEYGEPAVTLGLSHVFNACDYDHFTAGETKLQPTGADGNAIVCRDCHLREWGLNGWDKLKTYSGQ